MKSNLIKVQAIVLYALEIVSVALFVLYLGFMTHYYALFYDGTSEMFTVYKQLQVFNKEAFNLILQFMAFAVVLLFFELQKYRPGLFGLAYVWVMTVFASYNSVLLLRVIPKYRRSYLALDFSEMKNYVPSTFVFDAGIVLHVALILLLVIFTAVISLSFVDRLREGHPVIRKRL